MEALFTNRAHNYRSRSMNSGKDSLLPSIYLGEILSIYIMCVNYYPIRAHGCTRVQADGATNVRRRTIMRRILTPHVGATSDLSATLILSVTPKLCRKRHDRAPAASDSRFDLVSSIGGGLSLLSLLSCCNLLIPILLHLLF